jgi:Protein of unknown function (DUF1588)/Protein of unknown function (DUF1592)/Protein of unknown function (DUF1585)/Protein of unknown function (DUF1595)
MIQSGGCGGSSRRPGAQERKWSRRVRASLTIRAGLAVSFGLLLACCSAGTGEPKNSGSPLHVRLMSGKQYSNTIAYIFGDDVSAAVPPPLPPQSRTGGLLALNSANIGVTSDQLAEIQQAAIAIGAKVVDESHRGFLIPCKPADEKAADAACAEKFLKRVAPLWFRHPVEPADLRALTAEASTSADELKDFYAGLASTLEGMLVSPEALFIIDRDEPDPNNEGHRRLDAYSLAARLSFFLWNAAPDEKLLAQAQSGELQTEHGRAGAVTAMLASPRLEDGMRAFFDDMLQFNDFDSLSKDAQVYPSETGSTLADAREQTLRTIIDHLLTRKEDYRDLFTTRQTFMSMNLAVVYGVSTKSDGWIPYEFPADNPRSGLLTQVSFLAAHAHPARSSVTRRGKALRELFLCQIVPMPPPNVDFSKLNDPDPSLKTARARLAVHATNPTCAGCHKMMDPMGFAMEHFDGAGQFRATENGAPLDTSGTLDGKQFNDIAGLGRALHDHPALPSCLINRVYSYGIGATASPSADKPELDYLRTRFEKSGYKLPDLLRDIALSKAFSSVRPAAAGKAKPATTVAKDAADAEPAKIALNQH